MIAQSFHVFASPTEKLTEETRRMSPAMRVAMLETQAIEQLDHAHAIGDRAAALKAARLLDHIYDEVNAVLDIIEAAF